MSSVYLMACWIWKIPKCVYKCAQVCRKRWRGIQVVDKVGVVCSVANVDDKRYVCEEYRVMSAEFQEGDWEYERLLERVKLIEDLSEIEKQKIYSMPWEGRGTSSQGDDDFGTSRLIELRIVFNDNTPVYQRPQPPHW